VWPDVRSAFLSSDLFATETCPSRTNTAYPESEHIKVAALEKTLAASIDQASRSTRNDCALCLVSLEMPFASSECQDQARRFLEISIISDLFDTRSSHRLFFLVWRHTLAELRVLVVTPRGIPDNAGAVIPWLMIRLSASRVLSSPVHGIRAAMFYSKTASDAVSSKRKIEMMIRAIEDSETDTVSFQRKSRHCAAEQHIFQG
jgi:hypothetical protein